MTKLTEAFRKIHNSAEPRTKERPLPETGKLEEKNPHRSVTEAISQASYFFIHKARANAEMHGRGAIFVGTTKERFFRRFMWPSMEILSKAPTEIQSTSTDPGLMYFYLRAEDIEAFSKFPGVNVEGAHPLIESYDVWREAVLVVVEDSTFTMMTLERHYREGPHYRRPPIV